ncbi:F-box/kelch-repeat protein At5g26960-like [Miscanthus floridulus]|uniref:F-box/kelch-repeat protein At5g26960-like n=1 Tax=Miscanthus floridulus TaxID=154761 RepID=UPI003459CD18
MAAESCHPRGLSWFVRSCIPTDPARHTAVPVPIPISAPDAEDPDPEAEPPITALPDELLLEILARVPRASLPPLPAVCRRFASLLASQAFLHLRRARGRLRPCLLAVSSSARALLLHLHASPSSSSSLDVAALPLLLPPPLLPHSFAHARAVAVGRHVYLVGRGATLRVDPLTGAARACAPTLFPRSKFAAAAVGARIYVAGGSARTATVEEYDPAADAWRVVAEAPRRRYGCAGAGAAGVFYVAGGVAVGGGRGSAAAALVEAHACAGSVDALHVASGAWAWARPRAVPGGGCVVGACGAGDGHLYVVASHAVDLSFWRWHGGGGGSRGGGAGAAGGWVALEAPPVPRGAVGLGVAVRVAMAGVGADRVAAVVNVAAVRGHAAAAAAASGGAVEGLVLVYDIGGGRWSRAPDLPPGFRRAACAAVEC